MSIVANPGQAFSSVWAYRDVVGLAAATGKTGTMAVQIQDATSGNVAQTRGTGSIAETPTGSGIYVFNGIAPGGGSGTFSIVWDDSPPTTPGRKTFTDTLVTGSAGAPVSGYGIGRVGDDPSEPIYCSVQDLAEAVRDNPDVTLPAGVDTVTLRDTTAVPNVSIAALTRLIERAEDDIDNVLLAASPYIMLPTGRKLDPTNTYNNPLIFTPRLLPYQVDKLRRATAAQGEYRLTMGEDFFAKAQAQSVSGPVFRVQGRFPIVGPKTHREIHGSGIVSIGGRTTNGRPARPRRVLGNVPLGRIN